MAALSNPIMFVSFSIAPDLEVDFTRFYQREFLPVLLRHSPQILNVRRFEEFGVSASLSWYGRQFLTIYELRSDDVMDNIDEVFANENLREVVDTFRSWKDRAIKNFVRRNYRNTWRHARGAEHKATFSGPLFLWQTEMKPAYDSDFQNWYEDDYLPVQVAEIPTWTEARRYKSVGGDTTRHLTVFECANEGQLERSLLDLRGPNRLEQNQIWHTKVMEAVSWQAASSFRPTYRWPD